MIAEIAAMRWAEERGMPQTAVSLAETSHPTPAASGPITVAVQVGAVRLLVDLEPRQIRIVGRCDLIESDGEDGYRWIQTGLREQPRDESLQVVRPATQA